MVNRLIVSVEFGLGAQNVVPTLLSVCLSPFPSSSVLALFMYFLSL